MSPRRLVPTGVAARELGVVVRTLQRWATQGVVTPVIRTPGGHHRWDLDDLQRQLARLRETSDGTDESASSYDPGH